MITIGKITSTQGNKGEVKVMPLTEDIGRFNNLKNIFIHGKSYIITKSRIFRNKIILKFENLDKIEDAKDMVGHLIEIPINESIELPEDSYFIHEIIGIDVFLESSMYLGKITDIIKTGSNDVYIVKNKDGNETLIPAIKDIVKVIDIKNKKIIIRYIDGLI